MAFFLKPDKDWVQHRLDTTCTVDAFASVLPSSAFPVPSSVVCVLSATVRESSGGRVLD